MTAKLPTDIEYYPDFIADPRDVFSDVLEEFFSQEPEPVLYGGPRIGGLSFRNDRPNSYTKALDLKRREMNRRLWLPMTGFLAGQVAEVTGLMPSVAIFNFYRDGKDFLEFHTDLDNAIGPGFDDVVVATVSLGAERLFRMRRIGNTGNECHQMLGAGSLFVMRGAVQREWLHSVPPTDKPGSRLSITFLHDKLDTRYSWILSEVSEDTRRISGESISSVLREWAGPIPTPVCAGTKEEVFAAWCLRDWKQCIGLGAGSAFLTPQKMLDEHPDLREHIPEGSIFVPAPEDGVRDLPNPEDFPMQEYPTPWLKEMIQSAQAEVDSRSSPDPSVVE